MEIITKTERVFESNSACPGCGSILGLKFLLQAIEDTKNVILVTSPGEIALLGKSGIRVNVVNSRNPAATARGLAAAKPDALVIVYSGDVYTNRNLPDVLRTKENVLYVCYNNTLYVDGAFRKTEFARVLASRASYTATANVAYYEDFIAKARKALALGGLRFIDLLCPCPVLWKFDSSNMVEIGRMATESNLWPLYEVDGRVSVTKIPPQVETVQRYFDVLKAQPSADLQALQEKTTRSWRALNEGKLL